MDNYCVLQGIFIVFTPLANPQIEATHFRSNIHRKKGVTIAYFEIRQFARCQIAVYSLKYGMWGGKPSSIDFHGSVAGNSLIIVQKCDHSRACVPGVGFEPTLSLENQSLNLAP